MPAYDLSQIAHPSRLHRRLLTEVSPGHYELCIDNTTLEKMLTCPRAFELYAVLGRDSGERDALNYGSAIHKSLETYYLGGTLDDMIESLVSAFNDKPCSPGSWRNFDHGLEAVKQYHTWRQQLSMIRWEPIELPARPEIQELQRKIGVAVSSTQKAVEVPFKIELFRKESNGETINYPSSLVCDRATEPTGGSMSNEKTAFTYSSITVYWTGKIDLIIAQDGKKKILDHKTTSMMGDTFWGQFRLSSQFRGYCWATSQLLGEPVRHAIIDAIVGRAPTLKGKGSQHENQFQEFEYTDQQIEDWRVDTILHIERIFSYLFKGYFPQANTWCFNKYGKCPYFDCCSMSPKAGAQLLMSGQYAERTWDPLKA